MYCGFTITIQGMAHNGYGHDTLSKPKSFSFLVRYHYNQCSQFNSIVK